jgi:two-component system cell cycle sensor histidine kinase/response regulator CckA
LIANDRTLPPPNWKEEDRLKAIASYEILDTPAEQDCDDISRLASEICDAPVALISIVTEGRQWFKARVGLDIRETPLEAAICTYAIRQREMFVVPDLTKDPRFNDNPLVFGEPHIKFYAGVPLETPEGLPIGTLCVLDYKPRTLTEKQAFALKALARQVMIQLELRRSLKAKSKNEDRFRLLVDSNVQGVIFWGRDGRITGANDAFLRLVHHTRADLEESRINWVALTPQEYAHLDQRALAQIAATGTCEPYEKEYVLKDGTRVSILLGAAAFKDDPEEGVCFILDLTERKKLEQQFLRAQRMESIGTLAGGIAHDLNNILAPIMMSIDILKLTATDSHAKAILETIAVSSRRGADIVRQVLSFARGMEGERMVVQPSHLLKDMETIIKDTFPKNIHLALSLPDGSCGILGDPTQLHQILLNLCVNARDAMPDGGSLTIAVENSVLDEQYASMHFEAMAGRYVAISVTDSGQGMPPTVIEKIFDPFFTTKELGKGTGLGLSTVRAIVKSHGGFINVYSEPGRGTTFKIYLPAMDAAAGGLKDEVEESSLPRGNGETILIVDDEPSILIVTSKTLEAFGYRTLTADDGAEAIAIYAEKRDKISVVLTDMAMPIMDGTATIRALLKLNPAVKIVAASGLNANGADSKMFGIAVKHFLTKPYTAGTMLKVMRAILDEV